jgi:hypothetical protein
MREHRAAARDDGFQADYTRHRPIVERSLAWLPKGNGRLHYRGATKNHPWWQLRIAALNLERLLRLGLTQGAAGGGGRLRTGGAAAGPEKDQGKVLQAS